MVTPRLIQGSDWWTADLPPENRGATIAVVTTNGGAASAWTYIGSTVFKLGPGAFPVAYDLTKPEAVPAYINAVLTRYKDQGQDIKLFVHAPGATSIDDVIKAGVTRRYMRGQFPYTAVGQPCNWGATVLAFDQAEPNTGDKTVGKETDASVDALLSLIQGRKEVVPASEDVPKPRVDDSQSAGKSKTPPHRRAGLALRSPSAYLKTLRP